MRTLAEKENADMHALLIAYHFATIEVINASNDGTMEDMEQAVAHLEKVSREAEPYARKHEPV